jgi:triacylglycerol lipase
VKCVAWLSLTLSSLDPAPRPPDPAQPPVVIVHGIDGSALDVSRLARALRAAGREVLTPSLSPNDGSAPLEQLSAQLATYLETHLPRRPFDLVGYSMGGIITRHYVQTHGPDAGVRRYVSLSAPHQGTWTAFLRSGPGARQLRPGSSFLTALNADTSVFDTIPATSFWTPTDLIILPPTSSRFPGAACTRRLALGHFSFIIERRCIREVVAALTPP